MKQILFLALFICALGSVLAEEVVKVGVILPLSGDFAALGERQREGILFRAREQKKQPAMFNYQLFFEDDAFNPMKGVLAYRRLTDLEKCDVIVNTCTGNQVAPLAAKDGKILFGMSWEDSMAADPLAFIHCTPVGPQAQLMATTLKHLGVKRVAVMCMLHPGFLRMERDFTPIARQLGIETQTVKFNGEERDFRAYLLRLRDFHPDVYVLLAPEPSFQILIQRIRSEDKKVMITAVEGFSYFDKLDEYNGYFYVAGNEATEEFKEKYLSANSKPAMGFVGNAYDIMDLIIHSYETAGAQLGRKPTTIEAAEVLHNLKDYPGAVGQLTMGANRVIQSPAVLKYIEDGKTRVITLEELKEKL